MRLVIGICLLVFSALILLTASVAYILLALYGGRA